MLKLYDYYRSSACYRVRIALNLKQLNYDVLPVHLLNNGGEQFAPDYQMMNPQSLVPTLDNNGQILTQSLAIIEYLDEVNPEPMLLPNDAYLRARVRAFAYSIAADIHPINNLRVLKYLTGELHISEEQKLKWIQHWIAAGFGALEKSLNAFGSRGNFAFGDAPSLADICLVPQMFNARRFQCDVSAFPTLCRIDENCQKLEAFVKAYPVETVN